MFIVQWKLFFTSIMNPCFCILSEKNSMSPHKERATEWAHYLKYNNEWNKFPSNINEVFLHHLTTFNNVYLLFLLYVIHSIRWILRSRFRSYHSAPSSHMLSFHSLSQVPSKSWIVLTPSQKSQVQSCMFFKYNWDLPVTSSLRKISFPVVSVPSQLNRRLPKHNGRAGCR